MNLGLPGPSSWHLALESPSQDCSEDISFACRTCPETKVVQLLMEEILHLFDEYIIYFLKLFIYKQLLYIQTVVVLNFGFLNHQQYFFGGECDEVSIQYG